MSQVRKTCTTTGFRDQSIHIAPFLLTQSHGRDSLTRLLMDSPEIIKINMFFYT
jgi:hypothetical protein